MTSTFEYIFVDNKATKTLALLHGTGGDEHDLLPLVSELKGKYNFLGIRGNIAQIGMNRFFKREPDGTFDQDSIRTEAAKLHTFLKEHPVDAFLGYSNGANMILALTFLHPEQVTMAVLLHPKLPFVPGKLDLHGKTFLVSYGEHDQMITMEETKQAIQTLQDLGATVQEVSHNGGHELHGNEIEALVDFLTI